MNSQLTEPELRRAVASFYDDYHQYRVRRADSWMQQHYWPAFRGKVLEFGGGTLVPSQAAHTDYCVIDLSAEAARRAAQQGIPAYIADGTRAPFISGSFDTVACYDVLEHIIDPAAFLHEMCRISRGRVVVAGPNYVGQHTGGMSRYLPLRFWSLLTGSGRSCPRIENPHLSFDEHWLPDRDAIAAPNAGWVADQIRSRGFRITQVRTWDYAYQYLNLLPAVRCLGLFMFVVGERI